MESPLDLEVLFYVGVERVQPLAFEVMIGHHVHKVRYRQICRLVVGDLSKNLQLSRLPRLHCQYVLENGGREAKRWR